MHSRIRFVGATATLLAVAGSLLIPSAAIAAEGSAPPPTAQRVLAKVHTDAVSTFLDSGGFALGMTADVAEGQGTRLDPARTILHLDDASKQTLPAGFDFIGDAGRAVWIAPERNPGAAGELWPGFSTESPAPGAVVGDQTSFTLESLDGPGDLELYTGGASDVTRLWSSDDGIDSFTIGRTHLHANWTFTEPGRYTMHVRADARTAEGPVSARSAYTVVVGPLASPITTSTALSIETKAPLRGEPISFAAVVVPVSAPGYVEFVNGSTVLGHSSVIDGAAQFVVPSLPVGSHRITARYIPAVLNDFAASASAPTDVQVVQEAGGDALEISGIRSSYATGDMIDLGVTGVTLGNGESFRWLIRAAEGETEFVVPGLSGDTFERDATTALNQAELAVEHRGNVNGRGVTLAMTSWSALTIIGTDAGAGEPVGLSSDSTSSYVGDEIVLRVEHPPLTAGQSLAWVSRQLPYTLTWTEPWSVPQLAADGTYRITASGIREAELALRIVDAEGGVVGQSPALTLPVASREVQLSGQRTVYRVGDTLKIDSTVYPERAGLVFEWAFGGTTWDTISGETDSSISLTVTEEMNGRPLILSAFDGTTGEWVGQAEANIRVTTADADEQLVLIDSLAGHYHQNDVITLRAAADPVAADSDTYHWSWKRPDQTAFEPIPDADGPEYSVRAQQSLDGTLVTVQLRSADGTVLATSGSATILIDDHGAPATEKARIDGVKESYDEGAPIELSAAVEPDSVLDRWEWVVRDADGTVVTLGGSASTTKDQNASTLTLPASLDLDGGSVTASLTFDDGKVYIESSPVTLQVTSAEAGPDETPAPGLPSDPVDPVGTPPGSTDGDGEAATALPQTGRDIWTPLAGATGLVMLGALALVTQRVRNRRVER